LKSYVLRHFLKLPMTVLTSRSVAECSTSPGDGKSLTADACKVGAMNRVEVPTNLSRWQFPVNCVCPVICDRPLKPKFHLARHILTRLYTFDVSSPCILAVSSLSNCTARRTRRNELNWLHTTSATGANRNLVCCVICINL